MAMLLAMLVAVASRASRRLGALLRSPGGLQWITGGIRGHWGAISYYYLLPLVRVHTGYSRVPEGATEEALKGP